jgi:hypothetical protein
MQIKFPFDSFKPVAGESSIDIDKSIREVFSFIGEQFFDNYPKWAVEVVEFELLTGKQVYVGAKAKQIRNDNGVKQISIFEITDYEPDFKLIIQGIAAPYKHYYLLESNEQQATCVTFRFELLEIEVFMRPFEKLIRSAIEDGTENTLDNIKQLINNNTN